MPTQLSIGDIMLIIGGLVTLVGAGREWLKTRSEQRIKEEEADTARRASEVAITERVQAIAGAELNRYAQRITDMESEVATLKRRVSEVNDANDKLIRKTREMIAALEEYFAHRCEAFTASGDMCVPCLRADVQFIERMRDFQGGESENTARLEALLADKKSLLAEKLRSESKPRPRRKPNE